MTAVVEPATVRVVKPPRYNFAGYCLMCERSGCDEPLCAQIYAASTWGVCPRCHGSGYRLARPCGCVWGVTEFDADHPRAVAR